MASQSMQKIWSPSWSFGPCYFILNLRPVHSHQRNILGPLLPAYTGKCRAYRLISKPFIFPEAHEVMSLQQSQCDEVFSRLWQKAFKFSLRWGISWGCQRDVLLVKWLSQVLHTQTYMPADTHTHKIKLHKISRKNLKNNKVHLLELHFLLWI